MALMVWELFAIPSIVFVIVWFVLPRYSKGKPKYKNFDIKDTRTKLILFFLMTTIWMGLDYIIPESDRELSITRDATDHPFCSNVNAGSDACLQSRTNCIKTCEGFSNLFETWPGVCESIGMHAVDVEWVANESCVCKCWY